MTRDAPILGWDVGGTTCAAVVGTADGRILDRRQYVSRTDRGFEPMLAEFLAAAEPLLKGHPGIERVGVSVGGPMNPRTGRVLGPPHLPGWDDLPLGEILADRLGLAVTVEHDAAACVQAEALWGSAAHCSHAAYLTLGTGCGVGVMIDRRVLRGPDGQSPELGHVRIADAGPVVFGKSGCVESFCSGEGIGLLAATMHPGTFGHGTTPETLSRQARAGLTEAQLVLDEVARRTGQVCALLADLFAVEVVLLGSMARYLGSAWVEKVRRAFEGEALRDRAAMTRIQPAGLGEELQDLSAIAAVVFVEGAEASQQWQGPAS